MASSATEPNPDAANGVQPSSGGSQVAFDDKGAQFTELEDSYTPEEEREVLRRIDWTILPMMCFVFMLQYMDKQSLSYASVFGLITDLNLTPSQYSWCASIFYIGQLVSEYPFIYMMSRFHLTKFVGVTVIIWGIICCCLAAPQNYAGFATVRFLLGFSEGAVSPAFVTITGIWYRKDEHAVRTALWIMMNGVAQVVGSTLMYGIGKNEALGLAPWRVLFLICGALTIFAGILFYFLVPNGPNDAWFLTPRQKQVLSLRMAKDREGGDKTSFSTKQLTEAFFDINTWIVFWFGVLVTMQSPVLTFASLVISNIGYDKFETMLYTAPSGAVQIAMLWIGVAACMLFPKNRMLVALALIIPPLAGNILLLKLPLDAGWGIIGASWLASCITSVWSILLSLTASNFKGNTKRAVVNAMFFVGYCAGCVAGPQLWTNKPRFFEGVVTAIVTWCLLFALIVAYRWLCARDNARRDAAAQSGDSENIGRSAVILDDAGLPERDLTEKQDQEFSMRSMMSQNGGNVLGLEDSMETPLLFNPAPRWTNLVSDEIFQSTFQTITAETREEAQRLDLDHSFLYMNYASPYQDPVSDYGEQMKESMLRVSQDYDPEGVFQKLGTSGLKLNGTTPTW